MLKGKKKLLVAQVLLGLMVAGNAYAADFTVEGADGEPWGGVASADSKGAKYYGYACNVTSKPLLGPTGAFNPGVLEDGKSVVSDYNIKLDVNLVGGLDSKYLLDADIVKNNKISFGVGYPRGYQNWSGSTWNVFKPDVSKDNTLELGVIFNDKHDDVEGSPTKGELINFLENVNVGDDNDIVLTGGRVNDYLGAEYVADYKDMNFTGRNLTLEDADGTEKIKSADMKGNITAVRALNVTEGISADGDISVAGGLTAGTDISAGGSITGGALKAASISAKGNIYINGAIEALNESSTTRAGGAGSLSGKDIKAESITAGSINANNINAGSINASSIEAKENITTGSMNVTNDVTGKDITINNGESYVGGKLSASGNLNIDGDSTLKVEIIQLAGGKDKLKISSTATGTILSATTMLDKDGNKITMDKLVDTSETRIDEGLFTKVYSTKVTNNSVESSFDGSGLNEKSKSVVETQIASLAGIITSADLLSNAGFSNASQAVQQSNAEGGSAREMVPYAAVGYGNMRQESGSYVDVQGSAFNIGFAKEVKNDSGKLLFGPMIEYGRGSYESYLDDGTKGDGNTQNFGLGVMARQNNDNGTYYEGSLRYGKLTSNYNSGDLGTAGADYDTDANYWGAHLGLGKVFQLNDKNSIDTYCKFFYTNQGSSTANILGSNVEFDAVKSKRSRLGFRFNHATSDVRSIYAGLAWQHEFDGSACATANGYSMPSPSIKGNSMMVELGVNVAPKSSPVSFDLGVSGWAGKQKGYSLNANMFWSF